MAEGHYDEWFEPVEAAIVGHPDLKAIEVQAPAPGKAKPLVYDGLVWDPETWGVTPQAQASLARAIALG